MEEQPVNHVVEDLLRQVAATQREMLARANVLAHVRARPLVRRGLLRRLSGRLSRRLPRRLARLRFVLPTLVTAGLCAFWLVQRPVPLTFGVLDPAGRNRASVVGGVVGLRMEAPADGLLPLAFSDGSTVALEHGARARIIELHSRGATVQLENGRVNVSVRHGSKTRWRVRAGTFEVTVTGTRFSIDWDDSSEGLTVTMTEGKVEVRGGQLPGDAPVAVAAGQQFRASARESRWVIAVPGSPEPPGLAPHGAKPGPAAVGRSQPTAAAPVGPVGDEGDEHSSLPAEAPAAATNHVSAPGSRSWQALARSGRYQEALQAVEHSGFGRACQKLGADDLVQLGDVARLARNAARAEQAYHVARHRFPRSDRPAFALGLVAFEQRQDFNTAAKWFEVYVHQYPKGALAREALGREMESWDRAGEPVRARRVAHIYLKESPAGPYAPMARQIISP